MMTALTSKSIFDEITTEQKPYKNCKNLDCRFFVDSYEKKIYDLQQLLEISRSLCSTLEFDKLIQSMLDNCMAQFLVQSAGLFLIEGIDSDCFTLGKNYTGFDIKNEADYKLSSTSPLVSILSKRDTVYTLHELQNELLFSDNRRIEDEEKVQNDLAVLASLNPTLIVPLLQRGHLEGLLVFGERIVIGDETGDSGEYYSDYEKEHILVIASLAAIAINNAALVERSSTDMMTHLKLKYYFFNVLSEKIDSVFKSESGFVSVLMFDIDFFKKFNDTYGHACGDYVLKTVASLIKGSIRGGDMASRYGGEEFTVMLSNAKKEDAILVAERIRKKIENYEFCYEEQRMKVTISVGVSEYDGNSPDVTPKLLVDQADKALYLSKRNGRNRVTFADPSLISDVSLAK